MPETAAAPAEGAPALSPLEAVQARREARKADLAKARDAQRLADLEALDAFEVELGDSHVAALDVPFTPGRVTLAIVRLPKDAEVKRYQARVKARKDGEPGDYQAAAIELGLACAVYPPAGAERDALFAERAGLPVQLGLAALLLSTGSKVDEGKG